MTKNKPEAVYKSAKLYKGEIEVKFSEGNHRYYINGNPAPQSVSKIIGVLGKGEGLINWMINQAVTEQSERIIGALKAGTAIDDIFIAGLRQIAKQKSEKVRDEAADEGTAVHKLLEQWLMEGMAKGEAGIFIVTKESIDRLHEILRDKPEALHMSIKQFGNWCISKNAAFTASEKIVYSKRYEYPGMIDCILMTGWGTKKVKKHVGDFKVRGGIYEETRLQLAAYQQADQEETGVKYDSRLVFRYGRKDGQFTGDFEALEYDKFKVDFKAFENCLNITQWKKQL